jgi:hypothetical protein
MTESDIVSRTEADVLKRLIEHNEGKKSYTGVGVHANKLKAMIKNIESGKDKSRKEVFLYMYRVFFCLEKNKEFSKSIHKDAYIFVSSEKTKQVKRYDALSTCSVAHIFDYVDEIPKDGHIYNSGIMRYERGATALLYSSEWLEDTDIYNMCIDRAKEEIQKKINFLKSQISDFELLSNNIIPIKND